MHTSPKIAQVEQLKQLTNTKSRLQRYVHIGSETSRTRVDM